MGDQQIYDHVTANNGLAGETYNTSDANGVVNTFTATGFSYGRVSIVGPMGSNINNDISRARQFYRSLDKSHNSSINGFKISSEKVGKYLVNNYGPGTTGDPKTHGKQYDKYGHAIYAPASSELRVRYGTILDGEEGVHGAVHGSFGEHENGEHAGYSFDQHYYSPGPGLCNDADFVDTAISFDWQRLNGK